MRGAILRTLLGLIILVAVLAAGGLVYRAWRQHENAAALAISSPNGIQRASFVRIGGIDQWIDIRGENRDNPVVLMLHGGPGSAMSPFSSIFRDWEKDFTVVQWDQRGAGHTYARNGVHESPMTIEQMVRDGIGVTDYVERTLHKHKIILLGHSWGSELGVLMIRRHPELYAAFVGTGFVVAKEEKEEILYRRLMQKLNSVRDTERLTKLVALGPPPYKSEHDQDIERHLSGHFDTPAEQALRSRLTPIVLFAPGMSLHDIYTMLQGVDFAGEALYRETLAYDARKPGTQFDVPFFIFNGDRDLVTPVDLAKRYFDDVRAPQKGFVILSGGGHSALQTEPDVFLAEMRTRIRPLAN